MFLILENKSQSKEWLKSEYKIDLESEYTDVQQLKNKILDKMYFDAKDILSSGTISKYRRYINSCGNNRKKQLNNAVLSFANACMKKKNKLQMEKDKEEMGNKIEESEDTMIKPIKPLK